VDKIIQPHKNTIIKSKMHQKIPWLVAGYSITFNARTMYFIGVLILAMLGPLGSLINPELFPVSSWYFGYFLFDVLITLVTFSVYLERFYPSSIAKREVSKAFRNKGLVNGIKIVLVIFSIYCGKRFFDVHEMVLYEGREVLVFDYGMSGWSSLTIIFSVILITLQIQGLVSLGGVFNFLPMLIFMVSSISQLSRSEFLLLGFFSSTFRIIYGGAVKINLIRLLKTLLFILSIAMACIFVNIQQGRATSIDGAVSNTWLAFLTYRVGSMYLGFTISELPYSFQYMAYPLVGFLSERFLSMFTQLDYYLSTNSSSFFYDFVRFGSANNHVGNVLYPWSSFFLLQYGFIGLIIKPVFVVAIIELCARYRLIFSSVYMLYAGLILGFTKHPFLNADSVYLFIYVLIIDFFIFIAPRIRW